MKSGYSSPEAWRAQVLRDEIDQLHVAVRKLEWQTGYFDGVNEAQVAA
ncbi:hypothetical protein PP639_gp062 [Arthrobacter phage Seahorse]|uniref:Uncharacterized protein n=1 Tax=Arthrobacter phage Seahorse TaxID=2419611 RepID=A0A3G3M502_9CAUD|nr:hypothetical protein PP639_gp062 [Arthrobacter phage Seahorse]AYR01562.1 hypothetical protein PBI_SEAHORSE_62 [Arthrobacter phage Seahorse]